MSDLDDQSPNSESIMCLLRKEIVMTILNTLKLVADKPLTANNPSVVLS